MRRIMICHAWVQAYSTLADCLRAPVLETKSRTCELGLPVAVAITFCDVDFQQHFGWKLTPTTLGAQSPVNESGGRLGGGDARLWRRYPVNGRIPCLDVTPAGRGPGAIEPVSCLAMPHVNLAAVPVQSASLPALFPWVARRA